jgi:hypothetical protein
MEIRSMLLNREEMLDQSTVAELKDRKMGTILPEGETLPASLEEVYTDFSGVLKEVWRPNHQVSSATVLPQNSTSLARGYSS